MELDIYIPSLSIGIEYDGIIWHKGKTNQTREMKKYQTCKENSITLIRIRENTENPDNTWVTGRKAVFDQKLADRP